jgi:drug/metabolite transporter (DMT)-like permease
MSAAMFAAAAPILFVLIWSTGFIVARAVIPHADPQFFSLIRMALVALVLGGAALVARDAWPRGRRLALHLATGAMMPGFYLCASWWAVKHGMPAGIMSLLGALQSLMIAFLAFALFRERLPARGWAGLAIGLAGVALVLLPALEHGVRGVSPMVAGIALLAVLMMAGATMIQHRHLAADPLRSGIAVQNAGGTLVAIVATLWLGGTWWDNSAMLWAGLAWSVLGLSVAALSLLSWMIRHQGATRVGVLLLLVPALAAVGAWWLFGEQLGPIQIAGFVLALAGVLLARAKPADAIPEPA